MKFLITYFYNSRFFLPNQIGISTAMWQPKYWKVEQNKQGAIMGICEQSLSPYKVEAHCEPECKHKATLPKYHFLAPKCHFLANYRKYLDTVDFENYLLPEFTRIAEEVRKINNFEGEPEIILLVYEKPDNPCSERDALIDYFKKHGFELKEYQKV